MPTSKVSVIIVSYNSEDFIEKCLTSLLENLPKNGEVVVVDNASEDKTLEVLSKLKVKSENLKVIENKNNLGFAKANNLAGREAKGEYLFFLNPDTEIPDQVRDDVSLFDMLINFYAENPDSGIVAPKLVMENGQIQPSVRKLPTILGAFKEYILGIKNAYSEYVPDGDNPVEVEMVYGAAILIRKIFFERLGGFDEKFFLYYEDANLCKQVRDFGKKVYYYPGVSISHLVGATKSDQDKAKLNYESSIKYHGIIGAFMLQLIFFLHRITDKFSK